MRITHAAARSRRALVIAATALLACVSGAILVTALIVEIEAGATAYILGEGHWSRARNAAVHHLYRYSLTGRPDELADARRALQVPLGDLRARLALDRVPPDRDAAHAGFRDGLNAEADIPRIVWLYLWFGDAPYFRDALAVWRRADAPLLELAAVADRLERHWDAQPGRPADDAVRAELDRLTAVLTPLEREFSRTLQRGAEQLRTAALWGSGVLFALIAAALTLAYAITLRRIRRAESLFRAAFEQSMVGMAKLSPDGRVIMLNERMERMLGLAPGAATGTCFEHLFLPADDGDDAPLHVEWRSVPGPIECRVRNGQREPAWCRLTASRINEGDRVAARVFVIAEDLTESRRLSQTLAHQASHDALTGLINRREIERRLGVLLADPTLPARRHTLCFLDLDQFKLVNDTSSHAAGDQLLRLVAATLPERLGRHDWAGRLGGDEFAILLLDTPIDAGLHVAERINRALAETSLLWEGRHFSLTSSIGLVEVNADTPTAAWLLRAADTACYLAKENGRNRVRVYVESDQEIARRHDEMAWANQVRAAVAEGRLRLWAQRIEPLQPGGDASLRYEVLVRMLDLAGNLSPPSAFMTAVERFGLAPAVDVKVLAMVLERLADHPRHVDELALCHVNVSAQSAASAGFLEQVIALLDASRVPACKLCFELTETASLRAVDEARAFIDAVRGRGCRVALDDFGSGLSSFAHLRSLDADIVKIDGLFVRDVAADPLDLAIVRAVAQVAHALGKETIAEWVEGPEIVERLREVGVDYVQGFAVHRPVPLEQLVRSASTAATAHRRPLPVE